MSSRFDLNKQQYSGINLNELRTLAENQILLENIDLPVKKKQKDLLRTFKQGIKQNKKAERYYKKIEKLKSKLAKLRGITL